MFTFLMIVQMLVAAALVAVILMQRSEGGGLGVGSSSSGLMTARGAADFLTRATAILATIFVVLSISLAAYATSIPLAFVNVWISVAIYVFVALLWLVPDRRIERHLKHA